MIKSPQTVIPPILLMDHFENTRVVPQGIASGIATGVIVIPRIIQIILFQR